VADPDAAERFDRYQERCLYDERSGFYASGGRAGRRGGDFITSPEVGPLFGEVIARAIRSWWEDAGSPDRWTVAEAGAGRGALAASVLQAAASVDLPLRYVCVERSAALRAAAAELLLPTGSALRDGEPVRHGAGRNGTPVEIRADLPESADVILANELLDNLPVRVVERTAHGWAEVWVPEELRATDVVLPVAAPIGSRLPVLEAAAAWVERARSVARRVVAFDYGVRTTAELVERPWLRTYAAHGRGGDPYIEPGSVDITVDVPVDQLPAPTTIATQAEALRRWGIDDLVEDGRRVWRERAAVGDLAAVRARSRVSEAEALLDPAGLGGFLVLEWTGIRRGPA
jgi:SAM-dependent MidA family methyltransferase